MDKPRESHEIMIYRPAQEWDPNQEPVEGRVQDQAPGPGEDEQVRMWTTERLRTLIRTLSPYVDGTFGTVSTKHAQVYMSAVRELNRLWSASYIRPPDPVAEPDVEEAELVRIESARQVREQVLDQLQQLRNRTR